MAFLGYGSSLESDQQFNWSATRAGERWVLPEVGISDTALRRYGGTVRYQAHLILIPPKDQSVASEVIRPLREAFMLANWITVSRFPLLLITVLILYFGSPWLRLTGVGLLFLGLMLDTVDGMVARKRGETSLFGSVLDIAADRTYELILWVCFADLRLISIVIPLIIIARTTLTDALRSIGVGQGIAPFAQHRTALSRFLVGSSWMRTGYAVTKVVTFCGLALAQAFSGFPAGSTAARGVPAMIAGLRVTAWLAVLFCVFRGLPVIIHSLKEYWGIPSTGPVAIKS